MDAPPVDPATGQLYKAVLGGKYLAFNELVSGPQYASVSSILATSTANAGVAELFLRNPTAPASDFPNAVEVQQSLEMMASMAARGKTFLG